MPEYDKTAAEERAKVRTKELTDKLETGMKELYNSDKYKDYLKPSLISWSIRQTRNTPV